MLARDAVHERLAAEEIHAAFEPLADALGDADRRRVPRPDQADHARLAELGERVLERAARALLDRPWAVAAQLPVTEDHRHLPPRFQARERLAGGAEVAHDLGIGGHRG